MATPKNKISDDLQKWIRKGAWDKAIKALDQLSILEPDNPMHRLRKGDYCIKAGNQQKAIETYHDAASSFVNGGFIVKALAAYKMILRLDQNNSMAKQRMEGLHSKVRESVQARPQTEQASHWNQTVSVDQNVRHLPGEPVSVTGSLRELDPESLGEGVVGAQSPDYTSVGEGAGKEKVSGEKTGVTAGSEGFEIERTSQTGSQEARRSADVIPLFSSLSQEEFQKIVDRMIHLQCPPHYKIMEEGTTGDSVFIISHGAAKVVMKVGEKEVHLADLKENDFFGEVAFLTGKPRTASVITTEETQLLELQGKDLREIIQHYPTVKNVLETFHQARVKDTVEKVKDPQAVI